MSVSDTFFAEKNTWGSSAKHFLSNKKETTDFTVYLRNSTNPIVSLTLRQAIRFSFSIADQQLRKLLLAICPFRQPDIIITASHFICQPLPGKFLLPPRFLTALSVPKVPTREQKRIRIALERKKILRKTRYLGMMYICAHSREEESCRKRPRSARECARAHSLFYGRRGDGCFLSVASVPA